MQKIMFNNLYGLTAAVLEGRKTMTRRVEFGDAEQQLLTDADDVYMDADDVVAVFDTLGPIWLGIRYKVGEVLAVAQAYKHCINDILVAQKYKTDIAAMVFERSKGWTNKMFVRADLMPHLIRITDIRVERLQDISDEDCIKEGIMSKWHPPGACTFYYVPNVQVKTKEDVYLTPQEAYAALIDKVCAKGTWESNPWVVVYDFKLIK